jgi:hypothetical protein
LLAAYSTKSKNWPFVLCTNKVDRVGIKSPPSQSYK